MLSDDEILGILYLQLTGMGVLGNCFLLFLYSYNFLTGIKTKTIKIIVTHLAFSNTMLLLFRGIPTTARVWGVKCFLDGLGIRIITYLQILPRGISLGITCLLNSFQAITLTPNGSIWAELKTRAPKCITPCILLIWIFNILVNIVGFVFLTGPKNSTESKHGCNMGYRSLDMYNTDHLIIIIATFIHDAILVCLMACSSGYMVFILYRHNQLIKYIHSTSLCRKISHETRATKAILLLVGTFIFFNAPSPIFILYMFYFKEGSVWAIHASALLSLCYPAVNPFILISIDTHMPKVCCVH
ncbi:vomeronasal type-1 receptor 3-like [Dromiciops gliroides]|uniref:vomeronasal type-1 receptor 3-like n=1 Tax=Dromiciops gliroides TaxID=33562 RepID=UPI001CC6DE45|nr:vomeronasal type-1 receptor 3-like [Dromiciops gliroides]